MILYADDTTLMCSDENLDKLYETTNAELQNVFEWTLANKISLNFEKTKYMIITNKRMPSLNSLSIGNKVIQQVKNFKFLGVFIDHKLNFKEHIDHVVSSISRSAGVLKRLNFLPYSVLRLLYFSLVYPYLIYGILIWGKASKTNLTPLIIKQKKCLRLITGSDRLASTDPLFKETKILKFDNIYTYYLGYFMYKTFNSSVDNIPKQRLLSCFRTHTHLTRYHSNLRPEFYGKNVTQRSIFFQGPQLWNTLPEVIKESNSLFKFRSSLRDFILTNLN